MRLFESIRAAASGCDAIERDDGQMPAFLPMALVTDS